MTLEDNVRHFFEILDRKEESDSGKEFSPTYISCCRAMTCKELGELLNIMKEQVGCLNEGPKVRG